MKHLLTSVLIASLVVGFIGCGKNEKSSSASDKGGKKLEIVMVAKHEGISWFDDMRVGINEFAKDYNVNAYQIAPEGGDAAKQVEMVENLIAKGVDAILVVPNDPQAMKPVLAKARQQGIIVISHEASDIADTVDYDMEAFKNEDFGVAFFKALAEGMGGKGKYAGFVGALTMTTHMQWFNAGKAYVEKNYPEMQMVTAQPLEDRNDDKLAKDKALEMLKAHPDLKGFVDMAASGAGIAQALESKDIKGVTLSTLTLPSLGSKYLKNGIMAHGQCWRPADAGYVTALIAYKMLNKEKIESGIDLQKEGYNSVTVEGNIVYGNAPLFLTKDNVDKYNF